jgi:hypothetical protein
MREEQPAGQVEATAGGRPVETFWQLPLPAVTRSPPDLAPPDLAPPDLAPRRGRRSGRWIAIAAVAALTAGTAGTLLVGRRETVRAAAVPGSSAAATAADAAAISPGQATRAAGVSSALAAMTLGIRAHRENGFLSAFDPATSALVADWRAVFRGMSGLPMESVRFGWPSGEFEAPARPADYPPDAVVAAVDLRYSLRGWDPAVVDDAIPLTFATVGGRWVVVGDSEQLPGLGSARFAEPWSVDPLIVVTRSHVLVVGERARRAQTERLATRLEALVGDVRKVWPEPSWNGKVVAYAMTDKRFVQQWFGSQAASGKQDDPTGPASFVAKVTVLSSTGVGTQWRPGAPRLIVTPYLLGQTDPYSLSLLRHEVTHVATALVGRSDPVWMREGVAEYTGFRLGGSTVDAARTLAMHGLPASTLAAMRRGTWRPQLVNEAQPFYGGDAAAVQAAYIDAWMACLYVADTSGDATLRRLYDTAAAQPDGQSLEQVNSTALAAVLHTNQTAFTASVRAYGLALIRRVEST